MGDPQPGGILGAVIRGTQILKEFGPSTDFLIVLVDWILSMGSEEMPTVTLSQFQNISANKKNYNNDMVLAKVWVCSFLQYK